jgi:hypothetical protein
VWRVWWKIRAVVVVVVNVGEGAGWRRAERRRVANMADYDCSVSVRVVGVYL